ncbi:DUF6064 family protein [Flaviflagellibacter deserti]|uniref:DUF6064 family protein n=1 Tax=Flaviflagellibacter deserti TaxID=2267266 RepID=A0ABV9Z1K7_9HYPH
MSEWWTYRLHDFLLFSPRVYWRVFELHNEAVWPLQILTMAAGVAILILLVRPRPRSHKIISFLMAMLWIWVAWSFLWNRYASINWAAPYVVPAFLIEAALFLWVGCYRGTLRFPGPGTRRAVGLGVVVYAVFVHPLVALFAGRPIEAAEVFGIAPDPTAIATLGLAVLVPRLGVGWFLVVIPALWCIASAVTLYALEAADGWIPLAAAGVAFGYQTWPRNVIKRPAH